VWVAGVVVLDPGCEEPENGWGIREQGDLGIVALEGLYERLGGLAATYRQFRAGAFATWREAAELAA